MIETRNPDLWTWAESDLVAEPETPSGATVTAVMVTHNGADWVGEALTSLAAMSVKPGTLVLVDTGSTDTTPALLAAAVDQGRVDRVVDGQADWSFAQAVNAALAEAEEAEWVWLLHDDIVLRPDTLKRLLQQTVRSAHADLIAPMLLRPARRHHAPEISELGVTVSHTGRTETDLEPGEIGQGQHDSAPVLGASTCGLLIRRTRLDVLGGLSEALPMHRDGVDLGWRANLSGAIVVTCPEARIVHRQATRRGLRADTHAARAGRTDNGYDRFLGMRLVLAHASPATTPLVWLRLVFGGLLRALGFLLGKRADAAREEVGAVGDLIRGGAGTRSLRDQVRLLSPEKKARDRVVRLRPHPLASWSYGADTVVRAVRERLRDLTTGDDPSLDELTGDDFAGAGGARGPAIIPIVVGVVSLVALVVAGRALLAAGQVTSSGLLPAPRSLTAAFSDYLLRPAGSDVASPPWVGLAALVSIPAIVPTWAVVLGLFLCVPVLATVAAWFLRPLVLNPRVRWLSALGYAFLPTLVGGLARGQVWLLVWAAFLPAFGVALRSWRRDGSRTERLQSPAAAALTLVVLTAIAPLAYLFGTVALIVTGVRRGGLLRAVGAAVVVLALLSPWIPGLARHPGRLLTGPAPLLGDTSVVPAWQLFLGRSAGAALPPLWVSAAVVGLLVLAAALALALSQHVWPWWAGALALLCLAVATSRLLVSTSGGIVRPEVTMWLVTAFAALVTAVALALDRSRVLLSGESFGAGQGVLLVTSILGLVAVLGSAGWWVVGGLGAPLHRGSDSGLPAYVLDAEASAQRARTLVIDVRSDRPAWFVHETPGLTWADAESGLIGAEARSRAESVVAQVAAARQGDSTASTLAELGIANVQVRGVTPDVSAALAASPGITRGGEENGVALFSVVGKPGLAMVVDGATRTPVTTVSPGQRGNLVISAPADPRWQVSVGGRLLTSTTSDDWRPAFALDGASGDVSVELKPDRWSGWLALGQLVALLALGLAATPPLRRESDDLEPVAARRSVGGQA